jgi:ssDNA-binding Zn-finger/Zn-ribbon topoisomerase 1
MSVIRAKGKYRIRSHVDELHKRGRERREFRNKSKQQDAGTMRLSCPACHAPVVLREGPFGKFYGCSRYPACTATINVPLARAILNKKRDKNTRSKDWRGAIRRAEAALLRDKQERERK